MTPPGSGRELIARARAAGLTLIARPGGRLHVSGPPPLPRDLLDALTAAKVDVLAELAREAWPTGLLASVAVWVDERGRLCSGPLLDAEGREVRP